MIGTLKYDKQTIHAYSLDATSYHLIAKNLVQRQIFTSPVDPPYDVEQPGTFRPPLTPLYLAVLYRLFSPDVFWGQIGLAVLSAFSCGLTYVLGRRLFGMTTGVIAGCISCVYPFFLLLVLLPLTEGLSIFLTLLLLLLLTDKLTLPSKQALTLQTVVTGVVFGLVLLNKAANIVLFPCIVVWGMFLTPGTRLKRVLRIALVVVIAAVLITPWAIRNQHIVGAFTPVNSNGGWTLYLGNNPYTEKNLSALEAGTANGWIPPEEVYEPFEDLQFGDTKEYEKRAIRLAFTFIWEHPGTFLQFAFRKLVIFFSPYHHILDQITWYPLALFSIIGLGYSLPHWRTHLLYYILFISSMSIPIMFTSMPRFRAPVMPFLVIYAAFGVVGIGKKIIRKQ